MIAALFAIAAALLVAGWIAARASHRAARLWAARSLVALAGANALQIVQAPGPWWPLLRWPNSLTEAIAVILWIATLALLLVTRRHKRQLGQVVLLCGLSAFVLGLGAAAIAKAASHDVPKEWGTACLGKPATLGHWTVTMRAIQPVVGPDYTGIEADLGVRFTDGVVMAAKPSRRDYVPGGRDLLQGSKTLVRWNGELLVETLANRHPPDCAMLALEWQPFAQWLRYGAWTCLAGALLLLADALRSVWWREGALRRIAMRREDKGRGPMPASHSNPGWKPVAVALICGAIAFGWQVAQTVPPKSPQRPPVDGAAMIDVRQSLFVGRHSAYRWLVIADAFVRHGQFGEAAQVLQGAVEKEPRNAEAWLALGDALYGHAGGSLVEAAELAYAHADRLAGPSASLVDVALINSHRLDAAEVWNCRDSFDVRRCHNFQ